MPEEQKHPYLSKVSTLTFEEYRNREAKSTAHTPFTYTRTDINDLNRDQMSPDVTRVSAVDEDEYAGNDNQGPLPEKIAAVFLHKNSPLTPPNSYDHQDDVEALNTTTQYYQSILAERGPRALALLRAAAQEGNKAVTKSRENLQDERFSVVANSRGTAEAAKALIATALEFFPPTTEDAQKAASPTALNRNHEETINKTLAAFASNKALLKAKAREGFQSLPTQPDAVDFAAFSRAFEEAAPRGKTTRISSKVLQKIAEKGTIVATGSEKFGKKGEIVGIHPKVLESFGPGAEYVLMEKIMRRDTRASARIPLKKGVSHVVFPKSTNPSMTKETDQAVLLETIKESRAVFTDKGSVDTVKKWIGASGSNTEFVLGFAASKIADTTRNATIGAPNMYRTEKKALESLGYQRAFIDYLLNGMSAIRHADKVDMALDETPNKLNTYLLGYAAERNKIGTVTKGGRELSLVEAKALGAESYVSPQRALRLAKIQGLSCSLQDPTASLALGLIMDPKEGGFPVEDAKKILSSREDTTLGRLVSEIQTEEGADRVAKTYALSPKAIRILQNEQTMKKTAVRFMETLTDLDRQGDNLIGLQQLPKALRERPNGPLFAVVRGEREAGVSIEDVFAGKVPTLGLVGDRVSNANEKDADLMANIASSVDLFSKTTVNRTWIHGQTPTDIIPRKGDVVFIVGGLDARRDEASMEAQSTRDEKGAITVAFGVTGIEVVEAKRAKGKVEFLSKYVPNVGGEESMGPVAKGMGSVANRLIVTNGHSGGPRSAAAVATLTHVMMGRRVLMPDPGSAKDQSPFTAALLYGKGRSSMRDAGYGNDVLEKEALKTVDGGSLAIRLRRNDLSTLSRVEDLVKQQGATGSVGVDEDRKKRKNPIKEAEGAQIA